MGVRQVLCLHAQTRAVGVSCGEKTPCQVFLGLLLTFCPQKTCQLEFPPGRMVYKRAQVTIWEVDSSDPKAKVDRDGSLVGVLD